MAANGEMSLKSRNGLDAVCHAVTDILQRGCNKDQQPLNDSQSKGQLTPHSHDLLIVEEPTAWAMDPLQNRAQHSLLLGQAAAVGAFAGRLCDRRRGAALAQAEHARRELLRPARLLPLLLLQRLLCCRLLRLLRVPLVGHEALLLSMLGQARAARAQRLQVYASKSRRWRQAALDGLRIRPCTRTSQVRDRSIAAVASKRFAYGMSICCQAAKGNPTLVTSSAHIRLQQVPASLREHAAGPPSRHCKSQTRGFWCSMKPMALTLKGSRPRRLLQGRLLWHQRVKGRHCSGGARQITFTNTPPSSALSPSA